MRRAAAGVVFLTILAHLCGPAGAAEATIAVAANFSDAAERLQREFERDTDHSLTLVVGSTGRLFAQIRQGAPYDALLAADRRRPELLESSGEAVVGSRFTYARGRLALWSSEPGRLLGDGANALRANPPRRVAIAHPDLAPYGAAARQTLRALDLWEGLQHRIVVGHNVGQTHALVASGNAEVGFIALSHVTGRRSGERGSHWVVPERLHAPIRQDAVLLARAADNPAARAFLQFLENERAGELLRTFGYGLD